MLTNMVSYKWSMDAPFYLKDYLSYLFAAVWRPISGKDERLDMYRRQIERTYVEFINTDLNPTEKQQNSLITNMQRTDATTYLVQHLDTIESYCNQQLASHKEGDINHTHYIDLIRRVKKIRNEFVGDVN